MDLVSEYDLIEKIVKTDNEVLPQQVNYCLKMKRQNPGMICHLL
jgi:hypothetical protein